MATATAKKPKSLGASVDHMWSLREKKRELEAQVKELDGQIADVESQLMEDMQAQGLDKMAGTLATVSISTSTVAQVEDWDEFWKYIYKNKFGHLLQRRVSDPAYRELLEAGKKVPGVTPFNKAKLNLRSR